jgi:ABC-type phosphate transport system substrate-binding protein
MQLKLTILVAFFLMAVQLASAQQTVTAYLLVHNNSGLASSLQQKEIEKIFQGKYSRWPKTQKQVIILLPSSKHPTAVAITKQMGFGTFKEMQKFWLSMVFQGRFSAPVFLDSDQEIIDYISRNTGAVGIVSADLIQLLKKDSYSQITD